MNLETLQLYCDVVRLRSFSRGAAENGVSQSAASQAIQQLESELHVLLLDRSKRPLAMTPEGRKFYETCRTLLQSLEQTRAEITAGQREVAGTVRVAAIYSVGLHGMSGHMQRFLSLHPNVRVRLECLHPHKVVEAVVNDEADLGVLSYPPANRALSVVPLRSEPMVFVCHPGHRLARHRLIKATDLNDEPFVAFDADLAIRKAIDRDLRQRNVKVRVIMEFDNVETIKQAIIIGAGVSLLPAPTVVQEARLRTLSAVPFDIPDLVRPIGVIHRRNKPQTPAVARFLELLVQSSDQLSALGRQQKS
ncbi:MAG: LysR family transcriptional regulator [Acidobacteria bacterium]|nr:LysR family transcriptional regulator [Acidobacteriota bacterium]